MRYLYKQTGIVVESDTKLDSMMFRPVTERAEHVEKQVKKVTAQPRTTTRKKTSSEKK